MDAETRKRIEEAGWQVGTVAEFLGLSAEESALIEMRLALTTALRERRAKADMSQAALAQRMNSTQPRVAKLESGAPGATLDLLIRAVLATGATLKDIGDIVAAAERSTATQMEYLSREERTPRKFAEKSFPDASEFGFGYGEAEINASPEHELVEA